MVRSGIGFDVHQLKSGFDLYVGGIKIKSNFGSLGHSDGDALIHAIVDALLGAACLGDIGKYFPSSQKKWKGVKHIKNVAVAKVLLVFLKKSCCNQQTGGVPLQSVGLGTIFSEKRTGPMPQQHFQGARGPPGGRARGSAVVKGASWSPILARDNQ